MNEALSRGPLRIYAAICLLEGGWMAYDWYLVRLAQRSHPVIFDVKFVHYAALVFLALGIGLIAKWKVAHALFILWTVILGLLLTKFALDIPRGWISAPYQLINYLEDVLLFVPFLIFLRSWRKATSSPLHAA
jgi:glycopeptide antibiotics resistance protein